MSLLLTLQSVLLFYALAVAAHILLCRLGGGKHFMPKGLLLGLAVTVALLLHQIAEKRVDIIGLYLFLAAWLLYMMIFINLLNSVTLKMLAHLHANPNGRMLVEKFSTAFNAEDGLLTRLQMMRDNGLLECQGEALRLTPKARTLLKIITAIGRVFSMKAN